MYKIVKIRKPHKCIICERVIQAGVKMRHIRTRSPIYGGCDEQIGVKYHNVYFCDEDDKKCLEAFELLEFLDEKNRV